MKIKVGKTPVIHHIYSAILDSEYREYVSIINRKDTKVKLETIIKELDMFIWNIEPLYAEGVENLEYTDQEAKDYVCNIRKIMEWYDLGLFGEVNLSVS